MKDAIDATTRVNAELALARASSGNAGHEAETAAHLRGASRAAQDAAVSLALAALLVEGVGA